MSEHNSEHGEYKHKDAKKRRPKGIKGKFKFVKEDADNGAVFKAKKLPKAINIKGFSLPRRVKIPVQIKISKSVWPNLITLANLSLGMAAILIATSEGLSNTHGKAVAV